MTEDEFWLALEWRICRELRGSDDGSIKFLACDGVRGSVVRSETGTAYISGNIWIVGRGESEMRFVMALPKGKYVEDKLPWEALLPADGVTGWLSVDLEKGLVRIDLSRSDADQIRQTE